MSNIVRTYVTFGQTHTHSVNNKTFDRNYVAVIKADSALQGREKAFEYFGDKFFTTYTDENWNEDKLSFFPRGYIEIN
jgi:hypothetical protein